MRSRIRATAVVCLACACGGGASPGDKPVRSPKLLGSETPSSARDTSPRPNRLYATDAAMPEVRDAPGVEAQVRALRQAIALYEQFIERARGEPDMAPAVRRSRERIEDARETIRFLLEQR